MTSLNYATITGTLQDLLAAAGAGVPTRETLTAQMTVSFDGRLRASASDPGEQAMLLPGDAVLAVPDIVLPVSGSFSVQVPPTNQAGVLPANPTYTVSFQGVKNPAGQLRHLPKFTISAPAGQTVDLSNAPMLAANAGTIPAYTLDQVIAALAGLYAPAGSVLTLWAPNTAYAAGQRVVLPSGLIGLAKTGFTSTSSFDASKWTVSTDNVYVPIPSGGTDGQAIVKSGSGFAFATVGGGSGGGSGYDGGMVA